MGYDVPESEALRRSHERAGHRIVSASVNPCLRRCGAILFDQHLPWFVDELGELSTPALL